MPIGVRATSDQTTGTAMGTYVIHTSLQGNTPTGDVNFSVPQAVSSNDDGKNVITPEIYFRYTKRSFKLIEEMKLKGLLAKLNKAFDSAVENGQILLGEKVAEQMLIAVSEAEMCAKGVKFFIEKEDLFKFKRKVKGGHISDTKFEDFTRLIPKEVLAKKKKFEGLFNQLWVFHYWSEEAKDIKKMSPEEKQKMKDPILFGTIKNSTRYYFIDDWIDEFCDLTFDEIVEELGKTEDDVLLKKNISLEKAYEKSV